MLKLKSSNAPKRCHGPSSTTVKVKVYTSIVRGIEVRIIDTPGLAVSDIDELKSIAELQDESGGKADMLLYCISILPNSKIGELDENIIRKLTRIFGTDIWKHTIVVFTFANMMKAFQQEESDMHDLVKSYADKFQSVLRSVCPDPSFSIVSIFSCDQDQVQRDPHTIIVLPAGFNPDEELTKGMKWDENIYMEGLKKCNPEAIPALLKVGEPSPKVVRLALKIGGHIGAIGLLFGTWMVGLGTGAVVGSVVGGAVGGAVGLLAGGAGAVPGAAVGADIGAQVGGGIGTLIGHFGGGVMGGAGFIKVGSAIDEYEAAQAELEKIREGMKQEKQKDSK